MSDFIFLSMTCWPTWFVAPPWVADAKAAASCDGVIPPDCNK